MKKYRILASFLILALCIVAAPASAKYMIVGNDEKMTWNEKGTVVNLPSGKDTVQIFDISEGGTEPKLLVTLELMNSISGPPTNLAITKDEKLAILANPLECAEKN
ncbi:MAG TPA: hypothetical protein P5201_11690, partial [Aminobacteriaceae bacterium]|nr:hypothetical protein [Aminobacteriaceae bacterium]